MSFHVVLSIITRSGCGCGEILFPASETMSSSASVIWLILMSECLSMRLHSCAENIIIIMIAF
jgi:hypothetical protein